MVCLGAVVPADWHDFARVTNDVLLCPKCGHVNRPAYGAGANAIYRCCGVVRHLQARQHKPLPPDFWARFGYGDQVPRAMLGPLPDHD
jgi:hypothetical protein